MSENKKIRFNPAKSIKSTINVLREVVDDLRPGLLPAIREVARQQGAFTQNPQRARRRVITKPFYGTVSEEPTDVQFEEVEQEQPQIIYVAPNHREVKTPLLDTVSSLIQKGALRTKIATLLQTKFQAETKEEETETVKCPECGKEWPKTMKYCPSCGATLQEERHYYSPRARARVTL